MLVCTAPKDGYKSIAFAALDNLGANQADASTKAKIASLLAPFACLDGINEKGVSIAVLTLDSEPTKQDTGKPVLATTMAIRLVLDRRRHHRRGRGAAAAVRYVCHQRP